MFALAAGLFVGVASAPTWLGQANLPSAFSSVVAFAALGTDSPTDAGAAYGIWPESVVPEEPVDDERTAVTLGTKFESSADGFIGAVEFYDTVENVGPQTAWLWSSSTGRLLATTTFVEDGLTGWKRAFFTQPVPVEAGQTYVVAYHAPGGSYATEVRGFQRSR